MEKTEPEDDIFKTEISDDDVEYVDEFEYEDDDEDDDEDDNEYDDNEEDYEEETEDQYDDEEEFSGEDMWDNLSEIINTELNRIKAKEENADKKRKQADKKFEDDFDNL